MWWCSGLSHVSVRLNILQSLRFKSMPNHGGLFFGLFVGFLDFLFAPFSKLWYYNTVQWSKMYSKCIILLIAWFGHIYDHCALSLHRQHRQSQYTYYPQAIHFNVKANPNVKSEWVFFFVKVECNDFGRSCCFFITLHLTQCQDV